MAEVAIFDARGGAGGGFARRRRSRAPATAFERHAAGEWEMPAKVYVDAPARRRLPRDAGARRRPRDAQMGDLVSRATRERGLPGRRRRAARLERRDRRAAGDLDCAAITSLRTGAAAAVSAQALARERRGVGRGDRLRRQRRAGRRAAWPPPATVRASASTRGPRRPRRWPPSSAGARARARRRPRQTSSSRSRRPTRR